MIRRLSLLLYATLLTCVALAQDRTISGKVVSKDEPMGLPGVSVLVKGTNQGTTTDINGGYKISVSGADAVLVFSSVGYEPQEVTVGTQSTIDINLAQADLKLDEVVVVGYGTQSRKTLTGSITKVKSEELTQSVSPSVDAVLQGRAAGVNIVQNSGTPGAGMTVRVRGTNSINAGSQPLYVVDGVPITTGNLSQVSMQGQGIDALADLNPNDIESVEVLKDASAGAVYGARAANGVVLITTKSGKMQKTKINFGAYAGVQQIWKKLRLLNGQEFNEYLGKPSDANTISTDWQDAIYQNGGIQSYDLNLSGGNEKTRFFAGGTYMKQDGAVKGFGYERANTRINLDHEITKSLRLSTKIAVSYSVNQRAPGDRTFHGVIPNALNVSPTLPIYDANGKPVLTDVSGSLSSPIANLTEKNIARSFRTLANIGAEWDITEGLTYKMMWGVDYNLLNETRYAPLTSGHGRESNKNGLGAQGNTNTFYVTQVSTLNYQVPLPEDHDLKILAGYSFEKTFRRSTFLQTNGFASDDLMEAGSGAKVEFFNTSTLNRGIRSFFGRINYSFKNKYILSIVARNDASSRFGDGNRSATFPSASIAYRLIEEDFMKDISFLSDLKIRAGYGITGNDQVPDFSYMNLYSDNRNYGGVSGTAPTQLAYKGLKWETTTGTDLGIDLGFFDNRLQLLSMCIANILLTS